MNIMQQLERSHDNAAILKETAQELGCDWRQVPQALDKLTQRIAELRAEKQRLEAIFSNRQEQEA